MRKAFIVIILNFIVFVSFSQNNALSFEKVIKEANSQKAFDFVRNMFGLPAIQDPFLHFKEEGISKLTSFCSYLFRRVEATSLIKFHQTREFWTNYSNQFTAGKWNYKNLYKNDSLAWQAVNYSIILIYAHEMGHYMSFRFQAAPNTIYSCEEVLANECLAAFANAFNGYKKFDEHKRLFIRLAKETAEMIPDSNKTDFYVPMDKWCSPDPMSPFLQYFEKDNDKFIRLYGYSQYKIMDELLTNYKGGKWNDFLSNKFYNFYNQKTLKTDFSPLKYRVVSSESVKGIYGYNLTHEMDSAGTLSFYNYFYDNNVRYAINNSGKVYRASIETEPVGSVKDSQGDEIYSINNYLLNNQLHQRDTITMNSSFLYLDSNKNVRPRLISAWGSNDIFYYLMHRTTTPDSSLINFSREGQTDTLHFHRVRKDGNDIYYSNFVIPDSVAKDTSSVTGQVLLAGSNLGMPFLVSNRLTKNEQQEIKLYLTDTSSNEIGPMIWAGINKNKGYLFMQCPSVFIDAKSKKMIMAYFNSFTEKIYLIVISEAGSKSYTLFQWSANKAFGPQMQVLALHMITPNKMYVLANYKKPGNKETAAVKKMLIQW
ncbi:MAG: hypothetical protein HZB42_00440 [Sphingobacteriales bacterium]|nr:hypothetical protein [Sphingobacteriales bacterium]